MEPGNSARNAASVPIAFSFLAFLDSAGLGRNTVQYGRREPIFTQGDPCDSVLYIKTGGVKISVLSKTGKEAVIAMLGPGDFFGEGCLAGQPIRSGNATATTPSTILLVGKSTMIQLLRQHRAMSDCFICHLLARNIRSEADLVDQLFNSIEKRLARTLLLLARYGQHDTPVPVVPRISQETLAEMIGTTRSRVNFFLSKFKRMGFIEGDAQFKVHSTLLTVVLRE